MHLRLYISSDLYKAEEELPTPTAPKPGAGQEVDYVESDTPPPGNLGQTEGGKWRVPKGMASPTTGQPEDPKDLHREVVTIGGKVYEIKAPWLGHMIEGLVGTQRRAGHDNAFLLGKQLLVQHLANVKRRGVQRDLEPLAAISTQVIVLPLSWPGLYSRMVVNWSRVVPTCTR